MDKSNKIQKSVALISLGCDKNRVDSETMLYNLSAGGFSVTDNFDTAQIIIVNTCAFINSARSEAIENILYAASFKQNNCEKLIVTGCLPQKYSAELLADLPEVDAFLGTGDYEKICDIIESLYLSKDVCVCVEGRDDANNARRILSTPAHFAYLKIADGCDNHCTFCTIPSIRGAYRSKTIESLVAEAKGLVDDGVMELILVAQDVTRYGQDLYGEPSLVRLIRQLSTLDVKLIRLMYCYPELVSPALLAEIDSNPKVAKYIDIPIQHASDKILKLMNRRSSAASLENLMTQIATLKNHVAVRTTVMVGFPQESEDDFASLCDFISKYAPEHVGVFAYSLEEDTPSARLAGRISQKVKKERVDKIGELHLKNCKARNEAYIGKTLRVLYEDIDYDKGLFVGRTQYNAPDIDTVVFFKADFVDVGHFYDVTITGYDNYDLIGEIKQ